MIKDENGQAFDTDKDRENHIVSFYKNIHSKEPQYYVCTDDQ